MGFFAGDRQTLERFRAGDRAVLGRVYEHYADEVARVLRTGFPVRTGEGTVQIPGLTSAFDVECGVQEVFLRAFSDGARQAYDGVRPYRSYLFRIARNWRIDRFRRHHREIVLEEVPEPDDEATFEGEFVDRELSALVERFVETLDGRERWYYDARYRRGLSQTDAAAEQGLTRIQGRRLEARIKRNLLRFLRARGHGRPT